VELLEQAAQLVPSAHEPRFLLGSAYNGTERFEDAVRELTTAVRLGGTDPEIYYHLVRAYGRLGLTAERDQALAKFSELKKQSLDEADRRREAAKLLAEAKDVVLAGDLVAATELVERSYALNPDDPDTVFRLAGLRYDQRLYDPARQNARQATEMAPSDWRPHFLLGLIERADGNPAEARASLQTAARLNPGAAEIHNQLGHIVVAGGDIGEALTHYERAVELAPENRAYALDLAAAQATKASN
jgi:cytochrome c-type biogenesis protein CcmH/NrfG